MQGTGCYFLFLFLFIFLKRSREQKQWPREKTSRGAGDTGRPSGLLGLLSRGLSSLPSNCTYPHFPANEDERQHEQSHLESPRGSVNKRESMNGVPERQVCPAVCPALPPPFLGPAQPSPASPHLLTGDLTFF